MKHTQDTYVNCQMLYKTSNYDERVKSQEVVATSFYGIESPLPDIN